MRELRTGSDREAELLTDMWNRSEGGWPGGRTGGVPYTPDRARREFLERRMHRQWVAEYRGEIVGYCNLLADPAHPRYAYVDLLNARPDHHGKGVGRRLVLRAIQQAIADGFERVDLNTWPGNLKAVPLYKKCGFFWSPETNVRMCNFIPTIVRTPLFGDFFQKHDWYQVQVRDLAVAEDVDYWHGVRVYRYRFAAPQPQGAAKGRRIGVTCDRQALMVTAIETDEIFLAAWVGAEELNALQEHTLHYELRNRSGRPVRVRLRAHGEAGVPLAIREAFDLDEVLRLEFPFRLPVDLKRKRPGEPPHRVITDLTVDGVPVRLGTAVPKREPVEIEYSGQGLPAGKEVTLRIKLRNRLPFAARGRLAVECPKGVECSERKLDFRIAGESWAGVSAKVRAVEPGAHKLGLQVRFARQTARRLGQGRTAAMPAAGRREAAWLRAFAPGIVAVSRDDERREVTAESDRILLTLYRVGGEAWFTDKAAGSELAGLWMPEVGPPFGEFRPIPDVYDVEVKRAGGAVRFSVRRALDALPGIELRRTLTATPGLMQVRHRLVNTGRKPVELKVRMNGYGGLGNGTFTLPGTGGFVQERRFGWRDWPRYGELTLKPQDFAENWTALEREGAVVGAAWEAAEEVGVKGDGIPTLTLGPVTVPAGGARDLPSVYIVACPGDYKAVRDVWTTFVRPDRPRPPEEQDPIKRPALRGGLSVRPALIGSTRSAHAVELISEARVPMAGTATLRLPSCVTAAGGRKPTWPVEGLDRDHPWRAPLRLKARAGTPTAAEGELVFTTARREYRFPVPFVVVGAGRRRVSLRQDDETVSVDNGRLKFVVSASHCGACVSLRAGAEELLNSSYPKPGPFWWMNPWFGGLRGFVGSDWDRRTQAARRCLKPVTIEGASGIVWQGVQVSADFTHRDYRWLHGQVHYLTMAGSNVLAVVVKARNRTTGPGMWVNIGADLWPAGRRLQAFVDAHGEPVAYSPDGAGYEVESEVRWAAFRCAPRTFLCLTAHRDSRTGVGLTQTGDGTFAAGARRGVDLTPPYGEQSIVAFMAVCRSLEEARACRWLEEFQSLP